MPFDFNWMRWPCGGFVTGGNIIGVECRLRIAPDERFPDLNQLGQLITLGFNQAKVAGKSVEISECKKRTYLFLTMPDVNGRQQIQVTGERV
jgi:hypothetical protein